MDGDQGARGERLADEASWWFLGAGGIAAVVYFLIRGNGDVQSLTYELVGGLSAAAVIVGTRFHQPERQAGWHLLAAGISLWVLGDLLWNANRTVFDARPFPSVADVAYLASYPFLFLGLLRLLRDRLAGRDRAAALDAAAVTVAVALPALAFVLGPLADDDTFGRLARGVAIAYPVAGLLLLGIVVRLLLAPGPRTTAFWLLVAGIGSNLVANTIFALPRVTARSLAGSPVDGLYLLGYLLIGAAALHPSMVGVGAPSPARPAVAPYRARMAMVGLAGLSAPAVLAGEAIDGHVRHVPLVLAGWCVFLAVVLGRLVLLLRHLAREAQLDPLTRLANRSHLVDRVDAVLRQRRAGDSHDVALLYLDIDRFKVVNDSIGHAGGDRLLVQVAARLEAIVRPGDLVARLGGDEFVVLCQQIADEPAARAVADRLGDGLADPFWVDGTPHFLSASIGISRATATSDPAAMLKDADAAMYRAKAADVRAEVYDPSMGIELSLRGRFEHDLFEAIARAELVLHYQPQLDLRSAEVTGIEALLRWQHPSWGMTKPDSILPIAEHTGLIVPIGRWVVAEACRQLQAWQHADPASAPGEVTVNVSRRELLDAGFVAHLEACLRETGLPPEALVLDVADDALGDAPAGVFETLARARGLGIHVCIDGFGSGRRSLGNVRRAPADRLKVDLSLVTGLTDDAGDRVVLGSVLQLGAALGLQVTVAGVESRSQRTALERLGCTHAQGNLWAPPLPPGAILDAVLGRAPA
jgi:diguanylate cyclase (GGDEF)-like protein